MKYLCCFCETTHVQACDHIRAFRKMPSEDNLDPLGKSVSLKQNSILSSIENSSESLINQEISSFLPLAPISCIAAVRLDEHVCSLAKKGLIFNVECPLRCTFCSSERDESSKQIIKNGILHCSVGPCRMHLESFHCSNNHCNRRFIADGRESYICIRKTTSAVTHAFVRKECEAVALSAGPISRRMELYLKNVKMRVLSNQLPTEVPSRSTKVLQNLCSLAISLMVKQPRPEFFQCKYCDSYSTTHRHDQALIKSVFALCVDGIRAGCSDVISFQNFSPECHPIPANVRAPNEARPRDGLIRKQTVISFLLLLLENKPVKITTRSIGTACETLTILNPEFNVTSTAIDSICGCSPIDFTHDVGPDSTLSKIRKFIGCFFDMSAIAVSLMKSMLTFTSLCLRSMTEMNLNPTKRGLITELNQYLSQNIPAGMQNRHSDNLWNISLNLSSSRHSDDIRLLMRALLSHSLPNFLTDEKSQSFGRLP